MGQAKFWKDILDDDKGHTLVISTQGVLPVLGCQACGANATVKPLLLKEACPGTFPSRSQQALWDSMVATGRQPRTYEVVGEGQPLHSILRLAWAENSQYYEDEL